MGGDPRSRAQADWSRRRRAMIVRFTALIAVVATATIAAPRHQPAAGMISGKVTYTGTLPKVRTIDMSKEPNCVTQHPTPVTTQDAVTGPGNSVRYVVVYISAGDQGAAAATDTVHYDQKGCLYIPHVAAMQVHQPLEIFHDDPHSHNIHPLARVNAEWNKSQPKGAPPIRTSWDQPEFIPVKCTVTAWHERFGTQSQEVTIGGSETKTANFVLTARPY